MIKVKDKVTEKIKNVKLTNKALCSTATTIAMTTFGLNVCAATSVKADTLTANIVATVLKIALYVGILLTVWGIVQLVLAFKNEDADSKSRAMLVLVTGIVLCGLFAVKGTLLGWFGLSGGTSLI